MVKDLEFVFNAVQLLRPVIIVFLLGKFKFTKSLEQQLEQTHKSHIQKQETVRFYQRPKKAVV